MRISMNELRSLFESADDYAVRGGRELLTKGADEPPTSWHWQYFQKMLYFTADELVSAPNKGLSSRQIWVFKRDNMMFAVAERDFFTRPG